MLISASADRRRLKVSVSDVGIGMSVDQAARRFEQFSQVESGGRGTGIGFCSVRSLVEAVGGQVGVRTTRGKGTTFTFTLPRHGAPPAGGRAGRARGPTPRGPAPPIGPGTRRRAGAGASPGPPSVRRCAA